MENRVTYKKVFGISFLIAGLFILITSLMLEPSITTVTGLLIMIISIPYLTSAAIIYNDEELQLKNLFGMTMKRYSFTSDGLNVRSGKVYSHAIKLKVASGMLVKSEYEALLKHIESKETDNDYKPGKITVSNDQILDA